MNKRADVSVKKSSRNKRQASWVLYMVLFFISLTICLLFASKTITRTKGVPVDYSQSANASYKVYLNENKFFKEEYLDMGKSYVSNLIKYVDVDFNYNFKINAKTTIDFDYKIMGEVVIENSKTNESYVNDEYKFTLLDTKTSKLVQASEKTIKENIKIDYGYYNNLANNFKSTYGVDTISYLNVYIEIVPKVDKKLNYDIPENGNASIKIPLSEKAITITINNQNVNKKIIPNNETKFNLLYLLLELVFFIPTCILMVKMINKLLSAFDIYTAYDRYVRKHLKEYDRLIVETNSPLKTKGLNIIDIKSFTELLDARDNLNLPILYLNTIPHEVGIFYILNNNDLYLLKISNDELESK